MKYAPVILFVYNRIEHTQKTIEHLLKNVGSEKTELYIFCDGPKQLQDVSRVEEVKKYITSIKGFKDLHIFCRENNMGLADSIITGVTEILKQCGRAIILEDDIITSRFFLQYMNLALEKYVDEKKVFSISGYTYADLNSRNIPETYFLTAASSWGWATWSDRWEKFDPKASGWERLRNDTNLRYRFNLEGACDWFSMLEKQMTDSSYSSWAIRWLWTIFVNNGLTLFPKFNLSENIGRDGTGVHCGKDNIKYQIDVNARITSLEDVIEEKKYLRRKVSFYMKKRAYLLRCKNYLRKKFQSS